MKTEDKKKLANKILWRFFVILFIGFAALYMSEKTGYYEYEQHKNVVLTNEAIEEFEQDVKDGKNIDIQNYVKTEKRNYASSVSNFGLGLSNSIQSFVMDGINSFFTFLGNMASS